jgi:xylitol oxidase
VEQRLAPLGARPHWGKLTTLPPQRIAALYERAAEFRELLRRRDPSGVFGSPLLDALLAVR